MRVLERVVDFEFLVLAEGECVVGEDFDAFDVAQRTDEVAGAYEGFVIVADAWHEHVADPDGLLDAVKVAEKIDDVLVAVAREFLVRVGVDVLDVHEQEIGGFHQSLELCKRLTCAPECDSARVDACVDSRRFCRFEEFNHEVDLCEWFAAAYGDAAVGSPVGLVAHGFFQQVFGAHFERSVLCPVCAFRSEIPCFRVVAELAAHGTALQKYDKADSRSIDRSERFELVDSSESHAVKIKKSCSALK